MRRMNRLVCAAVTACLVFLLAYTPAVTGQKGTITCESYNNQYHHCFADTKGQVTLKQQLSGTDCRKGSSWGSDDTGIWVDRGCRAEFDYGRDQGGSNTGKKAALAGGILGAIALGMVINGRQNKQNYDKMNDPDKNVFNKGWERGSTDAGAGNKSDHTQHSDVWENNETVFKQGYNSGYLNMQTRRSGSSSSNQ